MILQGIPAMLLASPARFERAAFRLGVRAGMGFDVPSSPLKSPIFKCILGFQFHSVLHRHRQYYAVSTVLVSTLFAGVGISGWRQTVNIS